MKSSDYYFSMLDNLARDQPAAGRARFASCIVYKNDIVSFGFNQMKSHPFQKKFGTNNDAIFLHAEVDAIKNSLREISEDELAKSTLYVCRVKKKPPYGRNKNSIFERGFAKPCLGCQRAISTFGIKKVFYSCDDGGHESL